MSPTLSGALASWLAAHELALTELSETRRSLEDDHRVSAHLRNAHNTA